MCVKSNLFLKIILYLNVNFLGVIFALNYLQKRKEKEFQQNRQKKNGNKATLINMTSCKIKVRMKIWIKMI